MIRPEGSLPRLLVLASTYPRWAGDTEPGFVHELAKRLIEDFDVTVLAPCAPGAAASETMDGVRVHRYRYAPAALETLVNDGGMLVNLKRHPWKWLLVPGFLLAMQWSLWRLTRQWRPAVVHAHWLIPQGFLAALLSRIWPRSPPFVVTSHGADLFSLRSAPMRVVKRFVLSRASASTVVSSAMLSEVARLGADAGKTRVEPMGVDLSRFQVQRVEERAGQEVLFVGRLVEKKGLRYLLEAMPRILEACQDAVLKVVGAGPEGDVCRQLAARLGISGRVRFLGAMPQSCLPELYSRASVFVAPFVQASSGDQEGLGLVTVEAAGAGCPIVAGDVPAVHDVLSGVEHCRIVSPQDTDALADAIIERLRNPIDDAGRHAIARSVSSFDWKSRAKSYSMLLASQVRR